MNREHHGHRQGHRQPLASGQGCRAQERPEEPEHERGVECVQNDAGRVVSRRVPSTDLLVQNVRHARQRVIVRVRARKRPFHRVPRQADPSLRLPQILQIIHSQKLTVDTRPIQPDGDRKNHQCHSNQLCPADSHANESNHTPRPQAIENTTSWCGIHCPGGTSFVSRIRLNFRGLPLRRRQIFGASRCRNRSMGFRRSGRFGE